MPTDLALLPVPPTDLERAEEQVPLDPELLERVDAFANASLSPATRRAYTKDWAAFRAWCLEKGRRALPADPETVGAYLAVLADEGLRVASIERALTSISSAHKLARFPSPRGVELVSKAMIGIAHSVGVPQTRKTALRPGSLGAMLSHIPPTLLGTRDRALLLVGFCGGFRRSELVALDVSDLAFTEDGLEVLIRRSKTDQAGKGRKIGLPLGSTALRCPVRSVRAWFDAAGISTGPVFRGLFTRGKDTSATERRLSDRAVARTVKRYAALADLDPAVFSGHSLRAGLVTSAYKAQKSHDSIMAQTGHMSFDMVRRYIRDASLFEDNAAAGLL